MCTIELLFKNTFSRKEIIPITVRRRKKKLKLAIYNYTEK